MRQIPGELEDTRILPVAFSSLLHLALAWAQLVMGIAEPFFFFWEDFHLQQGWQLQQPGSRTHLEHV